MGKILDDETKKKIKQEIFLESLFSILFIIAILVFVILIFVNVCFGAETKQIKKTVNQSTSLENKIRKQQFNNCIQQTGSRSYCYAIYY